MPKGGWYRDTTKKLAAGAGSLHHVSPALQARPFVPEYVEAAFL